MLSLIVGALFLLFIVAVVWRLWRLLEGDEPIEAGGSYGRRLFLRSRDRVEPGGNGPTRPGV